GNRSTESIRPLRYAISSGGSHPERRRGMRGMAQRELLRNFSIPLRVTLDLFRRSERPVQARLATIGGVAMNDPVLRRFVDC
ncbi:MAG TPA: hypothetical protein VL136_07445, partial [Candidatus Babeliales bacterium]|nr:hypothetical protein [Candidatus Babeliales bacterium]